MNYTVIKRDGSTVPFDLAKIVTAIEKAFKSLGHVPDETIIQMLALRVSADFEKKLKDGTINVEDIQDSAETILAQAGYSEAAKAYILYRKQRENLRALKNSTDEYVRTITSYLQGRTEENEDTSNPSFSLAGLILSNSGAITRQYWTGSIFDEEIVRAHNRGQIHLHDLDMLAPDSAGWDAQSLAETGLMMPGRKPVPPAKHLDGFLGQLADFLTVMQNEWAGAMSVSHFDTTAAKFVKADNLEKEQIKNSLEQFIHRINAPLRWGSQPPFVNLVFDWKNGEADKRFQQAFFEVMDELGPLPFPIPTVRWERMEREPRTDALFTCMANHGSPWLSRKAGPMEGYFSWQAGSGSYGAVSLNLPQAAKDTDWNGFVQNTKNVARLAMRALKLRREVLKQLFDSGLFPFTKLYLNDFGNLKGALGIVGLKEAMEYQGKSLETDMEKAEELLETLRQMAGEENLVLMATPAESAAGRMARLDKYETKPYYTNGTRSNLKDFTKEVQVQEALQGHLSGSTHFSLYPDRNLDAEELGLIANRLYEKTALPVFCYDVPGADLVRISGSWMPLEQANPAKKKEYEDRNPVHL